MAPKHKGPAASPNAKSSASKGKQVALKAKAGGVKKKKSTICGISGSASMVADDHILLGSCETTLSRDVVSGKFISTQKAKTVTSRNGVRVTQILQTDVELTATEVAMAAATVAQGKVRNMAAKSLTSKKQPKLVDW